MKLEKYNQRLLAVTGTLVLASLVVILLISGTFFVIEFVRDLNRSNRDNTLVAKPTYDSITGTLTRTQQITFEKPVLIDSAERLYIVPVSQVNLENPEEFNEVLLDRIDGYGRASLRVEKGMSRKNYYGRFNNFIIYNQGLEQSRFVFTHKVSINHFMHGSLNGTFYLLIEGTKTDTNSDGLLNDDDLGSFFVYEIATEKLTEFNYPSMGLVDYYLTRDETEIILSFAIDKNNNGQIEDYQEPVILKKLTIEKLEATDFIEQSEIDWLQKTVDN